MKFNEYKGLDLPKVAEEVLKKWDADDTFHKSISTREGHPAFVFYEGPPSANGMPGIHHVMARTIKDVICRYKTQQGYLVHRKAGWDTHGLPVELGVEKKLGITKEDIGRKISIEEYNRTCREAVMEFTDVWENLTHKMGYWVNMDDPYITYDNKYIETLWYLLKKLYEKGLLYKGYTIQPYSPAAGTGLSTHELNQPGCYRDVKDTTCTAQFEIVRDERSDKLFEGVQGKLYFLAWTTTPWTLPSNTALAVGPAIEYVRVKCRNPYTDEPQTVILAKSLADAYFTKKMEGTFEVEDKIWLGTELEGVGEAAGRRVPRNYGRLCDHFGRYGHRAYRADVRRRRRPRGQDRGHRASVHGRQGGKEPAYGRPQGAFLPLGGSRRGVREEQRRCRRVRRIRGSLREKRL